MEISGTHLPLPEQPWAPRFFLISVHPRNQSRLPRRAVGLAVDPPQTLPGFLDQHHQSRLGESVVSGFRFSTSRLFASLHGLARTGSRPIFPPTASPFFWNPLGGL